MAVHGLLFSVISDRAMSERPGMPATALRSIAGALRSILNPSVLTTATVDPSPRSRNRQPLAAALGPGLFSAAPGPQLVGASIDNMITGGGATKKVLRPFWGCDTVRCQPVQGVRPCYITNL